MARQPRDMVQIVRREFIGDDQRRRAGRERDAGHVDFSPASAYEAVTRQMVEALADDLREIKGRLNGLLWMVASAIVIDLIFRLSGAGL